MLAHNHFFLYSAYVASEIEIITYNLYFVFSFEDKYFLVILFGYVYEMKSTHVCVLWAMAKRFWDVVIIMRPQ